MFSFSDAQETHAHALAILYATPLHARRTSGAMAVHVISEAFPQKAVQCSSI